MSTSTVNTRITLSQQLAYLSDIARQTLQSLRETTPATGNTLDHLDQIILDLQRLSQQAAHLEEERRQLQALADIGGIVNSTLDLNAVLRTLMDTIVRLTGAERGFLMLTEPDGELAIRLARNWEREGIAEADAAISRTIIQRVVQERKPVLTTNAQEDPRFGSQQSIVAYSLRSILCVPLNVKGDLIGVIYIDNRIRTGIFSEADRRLLAALADQAAVAIENARLFDSVRRTLAEVSALKGLMDNVFASIASGVITADQHDQVSLVNRAAERILGRPAEMLVGHDLLELLPAEHAALLADYANRVRQSNTTLIGVEINPQQDGKGRLNWSLNISPLKNAQHDIQGVAIVLDDLTEQKRLQAERRMFERMVSPAVIRQLDPDQLRLGGERREITCLFADVRGFTRFSESSTPEQLFQVLNQYVAAAAEAILAEQGTVDKFLGDGVMAWFNAPVEQEDHAIRAVRAALAIQNSVARLHTSLPPEAHLAYRIGIHYGEALLGLVGTEQRLDYTAIGDSVNTAKRIQENSAPHKILISAAVFDLVSKQVETRIVEPITAKGKSQPINVYEVIGLKSSG